MDKSKSFVIGIAGGSGAGKTTLINGILGHTGTKGVVVIRHDWYYRHNPHLSPSRRTRVNYDHPDALETALLTDHLKLLLAGRSVETPRYDYNTHLRREQTRTVHPARVIIIDGILILHDNALRDLMDLKIYVQADPDLRFIRRMQRDVEHRGRTCESVVSQYLETVKPMHERFVSPSKVHADIVIPDGGQNPGAIDLLKIKIQSLLKH